MLYFLTNFILSYASVLRHLSDRNCPICMCQLVSDVRCGPRSPTRAGHDVAGMGLPGHLDSLGPARDSEVLARVLASTSRLHTSSFEVARRTGSDAGHQPVENHLQAVTGH